MQLARTLVFCAAGRSHCACAGQYLLLFSPTYAHTARPCRALSGLLFYATSWRFPRSSQEGNLDVPSKTSLSARKRRCAIASLMFARNCANSDFVFAFGSPNANTEVVRRMRRQRPWRFATHLVMDEISNKNGIATALANSKPICGVRYMPRRWRSLAETKIPAVPCQNGGR